MPRHEGDEDIPWEIAEVWHDYDATSYVTNNRGIGLVDMVRAIAESRPAARAATWPCTLSRWGRPFWSLPGRSVLSLSTPLLSGRNLCRRKLQIEKYQ
jgi:hypothetical protein